MQCPQDHKRSKVIASDGLLDMGGWKKRGKVEWCPDCGGVRGSTPTQFGSWLLPGDKAIALCEEADRRGDIARLFPGESDRLIQVDGEDDDPPEPS